jgi:cellulose synthase/poly-beta-1,6-N-acetylglucosamine synthase-like glycosyltransferase
MSEMIPETLTAVAILTTVYVAGCYLSQIFMLIFGWAEIRRQKQGRHAWHPEQVLNSRELPGITAVIPAYNESISIVRTVRSILDSAYPDLEVIVVNDGSTDATLASLIKAFDLFVVTRRDQEFLPSQPIRQVLHSRYERRLRVIDKRNGGKADALNAGASHASKGLICAVDADVLLDRWALFHLVRPCLDDHTTVASSGMIRLTNGCRQEQGRIVERRLARPWLESFQVLEYIRAFSIGRLFFNRLNGHVIISGAFGLFRREVVLELGGYQPFSIGEDMELVVRLHRHLRDAGRAYRITFVADALCYTEAPHSLGELGRQRTRWHQGLLTTLRLHRRMIFRPRFGVVGMVVMPYFLFFELLAPVIELAGWVLLPLSWAAGMTSTSLLLLFLAVALLWGTAVSLLAMAIDCWELRFFTRPRDIARLALNALVENFGYHHLTLYFRLRAFPRFYRSIHLHGGWRVPQRTALANDESQFVE